MQSDKTVLLEVDHELAGAARAAIAPFAELERAPEHIHTYRITPLALWNARAAGHDAEQVVDALVSLLPLRGAAAAAGRHRRHHGPLRPAAAGQEPGARPDPGQPGPRGARGGDAQQEDRADAGRPHRRRHRHRPPQRARPGQADRCSKSAGPQRISQATSTARRIRSACDEEGWQLRDYQQWPPTRSGQAARASWCCPAAPARRWSAPPRWRRPARPR